MDALPWSLIAKVSTGLSLVALMALAFVWLVKSKLEERERIIEARKTRPDRAAPLRRSRSIPRKSAERREAPMSWTADDLGTTTASLHEVGPPELRLGGRR